VNVTLRSRASALGDLVVGLRRAAAIHWKASPATYTAKVGGVFSIESA
jgi:hypothetical protein